jgi:hypothetical protein
MDDRPLPPVFLRNIGTDEHRPRVRAYDDYNSRHR